MNNFTNVTFVLKKNETIAWGIIDMDGHCGYKMVDMVEDVDMKIVELHNLNKIKEKKNKE